METASGTEKLNPSSLLEDEIEEMISSLKEREIKPDFEFEVFEAELSFSFIRAWVLHDKGIEIFEIGNNNVYSHFGADDIGVRGDYNGMKAVELFLEFGIYDGDAEDPDLISVAQILSADSIPEANPETHGPVVILIENSLNKGWSVEVVSGPEAVGLEIKQGFYAFESYAAAKSHIDEVSPDPEEARYFPNGVLGYKYYIKPVAWR